MEKRRKNEKKKEKGKKKRTFMVRIYDISREEERWGP
jgi:hypothetical protein